MRKQWRTCPECRRGQVRIEELRHGAECNYCHSLIEVDLVNCIGAGFLLLLGVLTFFRLDLPLLAMAFVAGSVVFGVGVYSITAHWFPLKCYDS
jgi:hypothetical protein